MTSVRLFAVAAVAALALAACGSSSKSSNASSTTVAPTPTTVASPPTAGGTSTGTETVALASVSVKKAGTKMILVDDKGMTLYVWDNDKTAGKASCTGACATAWPPLYVTGTATYGTGLTAAMFSEVTGPNGSKQLAISGKPLYHWTADKKAGDATGQDVNSFYVVAANGQKVDPG